MSGSNALDGHGALLLQSLPIPPLLLLLACLQPAAGMALQHTVLAAVVAGAEPAVTHNRLSPVLAIFELALDLLRSATAEGYREVNCGLACNVVV